MQCPFCDEKIRKKATICKHCKQDLSTAKKSPKKTGAGTWFLLFIIIGSFGSVFQDNPSTGAGYSSKSSSKPVAAAARSTPSNWTSIDHMKMAFDGNHTKTFIKREIDRAVRVFDLPDTEDMYGRMGSSLVAMRKSSGVPEIELLKYAIRLRQTTPGANIKFPEAVALGSVELSLR